MKRALIMREKAFGEQHPDVALTLHNLARIYQAKGDYAEAERYCEQALAIYRKVRSPDHPDIARSLDTLGETYRILGNFSRAETLYKQALAIDEKWGVKGKFWAATVQSDLATLFQEKGDLEQAESLYKVALATYENALGADNATVAQVLNNLAEVYASKHDYERARDLEFRALGIREKLFGRESSTFAESLHNLSSLLRSLGDYQHAKDLSQQAVTIWERGLGRHHPVVAQAYSNLAVLQNETHDMPGALRSLNRVNEIEEYNLKLILVTGSEQRKQIYLSKLSGNVDYTVSLNVRYLVESQEAAQLAFTSILQRKGRALDAMSSQINTLRQHSSADDNTLLDRFEKIRSQLATLKVSSSSNLKPEDRAARMATLEAENELVEASIGRSSEELRAALQPVDIDSVRRALPPDTALVEFVKFIAFNLEQKKAIGEQYAAYILRPESSTPQMVSLGEASTIDASVATWRTALSDPRTKNVGDLGRSLDEKVMRPVRRVLGRVRHVFVSPDGTLNLIPFAALVDENKRYLAENYLITYLTGGRDLLRLQPVSNDKATNVVIVADPRFDLATVPATLHSNPGTAPTAGNSRRSVDFNKLEYEPLPGSAAEAEALRQIFPSAKILTRERATEAALKSLKHPSILHIATHGFFLPNSISKETPVGVPIAILKTTASSDNENPLLRSGLILAGVRQQSSGDGEDGVLTALEVSGLDLWRTKLVVLSACETGIGDVKRSEGLYGLRRALVLAGSESQVISLWKVSDAGTRDLMTVYYDRLRAGEGRSEALRHVQLDMMSGKIKSAAVGQSRDTTDIVERFPMKTYRHPYYWAAFIQSGDWRTLDGR